MSAAAPRVRLTIMLSRRTSLTLPALTLAALAMLPLPSAAQYKIVGPDGRVTYTDRPPTDGSAKVIAIGRDARAAEAAAVQLPLALRQVVARFPVTLYTSPDCTPCETGRKLLTQRGVPFTERQILNDEDAAALERLSGSRTVPMLGVGSQLLRGYLEADWQSTLDVAGYPRESQLPRGWNAPSPAPLVARQAPAEPPRPRTPTPDLPPAPSTDGAAEGSGGIRF